MNCLVIHCLVPSSRLAGGFCFCALTQHLERGRKEREVTPAGRSKTKRFGITCTARLYLLLLAVTTRRVLILKLLLCTLSSHYEINRRKTLHQTGDMTDYCRAFPCKNKRFLHASGTFYTFSSPFIGNGHLGKEWFLSQQPSTFSQKVAIIVLVMLSVFIMKSS